MARDRRITFKANATKHDLIWQLQHSDNDDRYTYQRWLSKAAFQAENKNFPHLLLQRHYCELWHCEQLQLEAKLAARFELILADTYTADPSGLSFMDLPAEVRNIVYGFTMFGSEHPYHWTILSNGHGRLQPVHPFFSENSRENFETAMTKYVLGVFSGLNVQIRQEARSYFWSKLNFELSECCSLLHFLGAVGPIGRANIPKIDQYPVEPWHTKHGAEGAADFDALLQKLQSCIGLQSLTLELNISNVFYHDTEPLQDFLIRGKPLVSPGLEELVDTLTSLPMLEHVFLKVESCVQRGGGCHICGPWHHE